MTEEIIPSPPILSCDSRKFIINVDRKPIFEDYEIKTPKDLPGNVKKYIDPHSYYPFDDVSSKEPNKSPTISNESVKSSSSSSLESLPLPPVEVQVINSPIEQILSEKEKNLLDHKFVSLRTFVLKTYEEELKYFVQFKSYYGDTFFVEFEDETYMGDEKIFLFEKKNLEDLLIVSPSMTEYIMKSEDTITLFDDSVIYKNTIFSIADIKIKEAERVYHPSSYIIVPESDIEVPSELAMLVHSKSIEIESIYRNELKKSFNELIDNLETLQEEIHKHHELFKDVDSLIIDETDKYYDKFSIKYDKEDPIPCSEDRNRITFLNETSLKYLQTHFIFWNRMKERIDITKREFDSTIQNIYLQMTKDFPFIDGIPLDQNIDIQRSYPGKLVTKM